MVKNAIVFLIFLVTHKMEQNANQVKTSVYARFILLKQSGGHRSLLNQKASTGGVNL